ncbi:MAG: S-layer homology domain-containing protein [Firmicutes bacterium]|nr:S-layer homology domain-containing protein [Bacillota bacterium]
MGGFMKRILSCLIVILMFYVCPVCAESKGGEFYLHGEEKIETSKELGIITKDMYKRREDNLNREEASVILCNLYTHLTGKKPGKAEIVFRDTDKKEPRLAYSLELMDGPSETIFGPNSPVTKEEFAWYILKTMKASGMYDENVKSYYDGFADKDSISAGYNEAVFYLAGYDIIDRYETNFEPKKAVTIGEAAYIAVKTSEFFSPKPIEINKKEIGIGMEKDVLLSKFGKPDKISQSVYGSEKYVYFLDTGYFSASLDSEDKIEEIFTNSSDFKYYAVDSETDISDFKYMDSDITYKYTMKDNYTFTNLYFDSVDLKVDGIYIKSNDMKNYVLRMDESYSPIIKDELTDIINCSRRKYGLADYVLSPQASSLEDKQCGYMSMKAMLTHNYVANTSLARRFSENGINFVKISQNIACSTAGAADIFYYWSGVPGMRGNIYSDEYINMGAGCVIIKNLIYCAYVFYS